MACSVVITSLKEAIPLPCMREEVKWKKRDEEVKAKEKARADKMKDELEKSTKKEKEKVIRRPKIKGSKIDTMFSR